MRQPSRLNHLTLASAGHTVFDRQVFANAATHKLDRFFSPYNGQTTNSPFTLPKDLADYKLRLAEKAHFVLERIDKQAIGSHQPQLTPSELLSHHAVFAVIATQLNTVLPSTQQLNPQLIMSQTQLQDIINLHLKTPGLAAHTAQAVQLCADLTQSALEFAYNHPQALLKRLPGAGVLSPFQSPIFSLKPTAPHTLSIISSPTLGVSKASLQRQRAEALASLNHFKTLPLEQFAQHLHKYKCAISPISGTNNWCWLRAGWSIVLENTPPARIAQRITATLGSDWRKHANIIAKAAHNAQSHRSPVSTGCNHTLGNHNFESLLFQTFFAMFARLDPQRLRQDTVQHQVQSLIAADSPRDEHHALGVCQLFNQPAARLQLLSDDDAYIQCSTLNMVTDLSLEHAHLTSLIQSAMSRDTPEIAQRQCLQLCLNGPKIPMMLINNNHYQRIRIQTQN